MKFHNNCDPIKHSEMTFAIDGRVLVKGRRIFITNLQQQALEQLHSNLMGTRRKGYQQGGHFIG